MKKSNIKIQNDNAKIKLMTRELFLHFDLSFCFLIFNF